MKLDKIATETLCNLKCLNCVHQKLCFNLLGGMNLQMKAEDCKDFLEIDKDVWIAPCKKDDILYVIDGFDIYPATVHCIEASLMPSGSISWCLKISYIDEFETNHYLWEHMNYNLFKTKEEAEEEIKARKEKAKDILTNCCVNCGAKTRNGGKNNG